MSAIGSQVLNLLLTTMTVLALFAASIFPPRAADPPGSTARQVAAATPASGGSAWPSAPTQRPTIRFDQVASGSSGGVAIDPAAGAGGGAATPRQAGTAPAPGAPYQAAKASPVGSGRRAKTAPHTYARAGKTHSTGTSPRDNASVTYTSPQTAAAAPAASSRHRSASAPNRKHSGGQMAAAPAYPRQQQTASLSRSAGASHRKNRSVGEVARSKNSRSRNRSRLADAAPDQQQTSAGATGTYVRKPSRQASQDTTVTYVRKHSVKRSQGSTLTYAPPVSGPPRLADAPARPPAFSAEGYGGNGRDYSRAVTRHSWRYERMWRRQGAWSERGYPPGPPGGVVTAYSRYQYRDGPPRPPFVRYRGREPGYGPPPYGPPPWEGYSGR